MRRWRSDYPLMVQALLLLWLLVSAIKCVFLEIRELAANLAQYVVACCSNSCFALVVALYCVGQTPTVVPANVLNNALDVVAERARVLLLACVGVLCLYVRADQTLLELLVGRLAEDGLGGAHADDLARFWVDLLRCGDPADPFASTPFSDSLSVDFQVDFNASAMLLILDPGTSVLFLSIGVSHDSFTATPAFLELPSEDPAILPHFRAIAVHIRIFELTRVRFLQIGEVVDTLAIEDTIDEGPLVVAAVGPLVTTLPVLLAVDELANVLRIV